MNLSQTAESLSSPVYMWASAGKCHSVKAMQEGMQNASDQKQIGKEACVDVPLYEMYPSTTFRSLRC